MKSDSLNPANESKLYWNEVSSEYDQLYNNGWSKFEDAELLKVIKRALNSLASVEKLNVLDVGCGTGLVYELMSGLGFELNYLGLDISEGMLTQFKNKNPDVPCLMLSGSELTYLDSATKFDLIISANVAPSYFGDIVPFLIGAKEHLLPSGLLVFSVLNKRSLRKISKLNLGKKERYKTRGERGANSVPTTFSYSKADIEGALNLNGFEIVELNYQSVLGGVLEGSQLIGLEKVLNKFCPKLGHSFYITSRLRK